MEVYKAKHILISEEDDIEYIKEQIDLGKTFEDMAKEFSECDTASDGGDLGTFSSGTMVAEFEKALYFMKPGEIKYGVRTKFGYHIIHRLK
jgi:peptidyl-prolyl cis-trans isomerase C